jgi:hypothetical protein
MVPQREQTWTGLLAYMPDDATSMPPACVEQPPVQQCLVGLARLLTTLLKQP